MKNPSRIRVVIGLLLTAFLCSGATCRLARDNGMLKGPKGHLRWDKADLPLVLFVQSSLSPYYVEQLKHAVIEIEDAVGRALFVIVEGAEEAENITKGSQMSRGCVLVQVSAKDVPPLAAGVASVKNRKSTAKIISAIVSLRGDLGYTAVEPVIRHELLHVLGLAHDEIPRSIMYPRTRGGQVITEKDRGILRKLYLKGDETSSSHQRR